MSLPWPPGTATGVGSLPGTDPAEAARMVLGEVPDLPFLPELPARGPHADLIGRGAALLADLPVDLQPSGWRLAPRRSRDGSRARELVERDLDALAEAGAPPRLKVAATGPWTLAAGLHLPRGEGVLADPAAVADLAASLAEGLSAHLAAVRVRLPDTTVVLQLDEPALPAVLAGAVPTSSGAAALPAPGDSLALQRLRTVLAGVPTPVVHCCGPRPPVALLVAAGAAALSLDAALLTERDDEELGRALEAGVGLLLGLVPATDSPLPSPTALAEPALALWGRLGLPEDQRGQLLAVTPACGLAGASPAYAREALRACRAVAERVAG